jgi:hypothetical protein
MIMLAVLVVALTAGACEPPEETGAMIQASTCINSDSAMVVGADSAIVIGSDLETLSISRPTRCLILQFTTPLDVGDTVVIDVNR